MTIYFISYGDDNYTNSKLRIRQEAINSNFFNQVSVYNRIDIGNDFIEKTNPYINAPRGGGYWLWKSYFIKKTMDIIKDDDIIVYVDCGCHINKFGINRFNDYIDMCKEHESGILSFRMDEHLEKRYTTEKIFNTLGIDINSDIRNTGQLMATYFFIRKCSISIDLIDNYYNLAINNSDIFSDIYNRNGNCSEFVDNRHDQSVFSVLRKKVGTYEIYDESLSSLFMPYMFNDLIINKKFPFIATRIRG